jgi:streptomycin 3"-adenylyltransferase
VRPEGLRVILGVVEQTEEIVRLASGVLDSGLVGAYLYGSSVLGGLRPASDVDVLVVSRRRMDERQRPALLGGLLGISGSRNRARPVELTVVVQAEVRPWRYPPRCDFLYGEWLRDAYEAGLVPRPETMPDLALTVHLASAGDRPPAGPRSAEVLAAVPHADVVRAAVAGVPGLVGNLDDDTRNVLLPFARIRTTLGTGRVVSKRDAADWAPARLPSERHPVLAHARELYLHRTYGEESWSEELRSRVRPHVTHVLAEIDRLRAGCRAG